MESNNKQTLVNMFTYAYEYLQHRIQTTGVQRYKDEYEIELDEIHKLYVKLFGQMED